MALLNNPDDYDEGDDYTLTINYSDEELYALAILPLVDSEFDTNKRTIILRSFDQLWDNMQREKILCIHFFISLHIQKEQT